jgi:hypothetical protein
VVLRRLKRVAINIKERGSLLFVEGVCVPKLLS